MSAITQLFELLPKSLRQYIRKTYYKIKFARININDEPDLSIVKGLLREGSTAVDAGANFGLYTKFLSQFVGKNGSVYSYEPIKQTFEVLESNVHSNKLKNVSLRNFGLSDRLGEASMEIPEYEDGGKNYYEAQITDSEGPSSINISLTTLNEDLKKLDRLDFIKIDVEGHEYQALSGGLEILERFKPVLLIEINGGINERNDKSQKLRELLTPLGYSPYVRERMHLKTVKNNSDYFNFFFLTPEHEKTFSDLITD